MDCLFHKVEVEGANTPPPIKPWQVSEQKFSTPEKIFQNTFLP